ncbi:MAG: hypothetical protein E7448_04400 [Ruminococcaceae bacterium]|nr:hypothetical protein [Oscillospiraceae bacterium]
MGELVGYDDWLQAQNCLLGAALIDSSLVPRIVTELSVEDFSGNGRLIFKAMSDLFRQSRSGEDVDPVAISHYLGNSNETRSLIGQYMGLSPNFSEIDRYITLAKQAAKVSRLRSLADELAIATSFDEAVGIADAIANQLMEHPGLKGYEPAQLLDTFYARHKASHERIDWGLRVVGDYIRIKRGNFLILGAEPSGGKTAFALEQMWAFSANHRVLFVSLETDADTIFDRLISSLTSIPMDALMDGKLQPQQWTQVEEAREEIARRTFKILPGAGLSVSGIKAAALSYRADIVIIDYLQIIRQSSKRLSRYEAITEISMDLHILAQSTGLIVLALSQVTNRDPQSRGKPLGIHSARESGQIEADADAILMLDKFVEKGLLDSGCRANRVLRIVKNKNGRCCNIPVIFDGKTQTFTKAFVPNPEWERVKKKANPQQDDWEQLPMDTEVPF